jgi:hypothetical protein
MFFKIKYHKVSRKAPDEKMTKSKRAAILATFRKSAKSHLWLNQIDIKTKTEG